MTGRAGWGHARQWGMAVHGLGKGTPKFGGDRREVCMNASGGWVWVGLSRVGLKRDQWGLAPCSPTEKFALLESTFAPHSEQMFAFARLKLNVGIS